MVMWRTSVDVYGPLHDEGLSLAEKASAIGRELKRAALKVDCDEDELDLLLTELEREAKEGNEWGFSDRIDALHHWADVECIWTGG